MSGTSHSDTDQAPEFTRGQKKCLMPELNFTTFLLSLNASALVQLGVHPDPSGQTSVKNLPIAKQTIDVIAMLEEKTRGNLTEEESRLLTNMLYELRLLYVKEMGCK
ncbi:MAG: DUF1844 domain-containing protein [Desulfosalsimonadaceae bacterium]